MHLAILSSRPDGWHIEQLRRAVAERGHESVVVPYEGLVARIGTRCGAGDGLRSEGTALAGAVGEGARAVDAVLARIIPNGSLEQIIFRVDALHWLEERGVPVLNPPRAIERSVDKFWTSAILREEGLPTPETVVCERSEEAFAAFREMKDVIVKPLFGSMGLGMTRVSDEDVAWRVFRALDAIRGVYYLQRAVEHEGRDVRAFIVGERVIGAIERSAPGWRTNVSRGGRARAIELPDAWRDLALRAARAVGAGYAGVDLLPARDGAVYVLEVNAIPGWQGLQEATGIDVAGEVVDHMAAMVERRSGAP
ncbi:MAG TPA: RimK family alpha-L-glutamate ligase [Gemmatimonadaceae bacterium]|nr:RimK family alpha-L-glutamate ligase [Gemmatimonadaceae bacterium]